MRYNDLYEQIRGHQGMLESLGYMGKLKNRQTMVEKMLNSGHFDTLKRVQVVELARINQFAEVAKNLTMSLDYTKQLNKAWESALHIQSRFAEEMAKAKLAAPLMESALQIQSRAIEMARLTEPIVKQINNSFLYNQGISKAIERMRSLVSIDKLAGFESFAKVAFEPILQYNRFSKIVVGNFEKRTNEEKAMDILCLEYGSESIVGNEATVAKTIGLLPDKRDDSVVSLPDDYERKFNLLPVFRDEFIAKLKEDLSQPLKSVSIHEESEKLGGLIYEINSLCKAKGKEMIFKSTNKNNFSMMQIPNQMAVSESHLKDFIENVYFLLYEGSDRLKRIKEYLTTPYISDCNLLRNFYRHDTENGDPTRIGTYYIKIGKIFKRLISKEMPTTKEDFLKTQLNILEGINYELASLLRKLG